MRAAILLPLLLSCSAVTDTGRHTAGEDLPASEFCIAYADIFCDANANCCDEPVSPTDCRTALMTQCSAIDEALADPITAYDPRAAAAYFAMARARSEACDPDVIELLEFRRALAAIVEGTVPEGGTCTPRAISPPDYAAIISCQRGLVCEFESLILWTCQPAGASGADCVSSDGCAIPLTCLDVAPMTPGTCQTPLPNGAACTADDECASLRCEASTGTCQAPTVDSSFCGADS